MKNYKIFRKALIAVLAIAFTMTAVVNTHITPRGDLSEDSYIVEATRYADDNSVAREDLLVIADKGANDAGQDFHPDYSLAKNDTDDLENIEEEVIPADNGDTTETVSDVVYNNDSDVEDEDDDTDETVEENKEIKVTIALDFSNLVDSTALDDNGNGNKVAYIPEGGVFTKSITVNEGESVYDVLVAFCKRYGFQLDSSFSIAYDTSYVSGINHIYEFDAGEGSGWMYTVNGETPDYGASSVKVKAGDKIRWVYTLDYGSDL